MKLSSLGHYNLISLTTILNSSYMYSPIKQRVYFTPFSKRKVVDNMMKAGVIDMSTSTWPTPVTLTPQKDRSYLDILHQLLKALCGHGKIILPPAKLFLTLDLKNGYWHFRWNQRIYTKQPSLAIGAYLSSRV